MGPDPRDRPPLDPPLLWCPLMILSTAFGNRQYSYSPTVLGRVGLDHECEAHAGNYSPRGQTNMRKLRLSLPNLRKIVNIVKFRRAYTLEGNHYFKQQRKICSLLLRKTAILIIMILMRRVLMVSEFMI